MAKVTYIENGGTEHHVDVPTGLSVMDGAKRFTIPGIDGDRFVRDAWDQAQGGWVEYDIVNPETGTVQPKTSFVVQLDEQHLIGCGVYRHVAKAA